MMKYETLELTPESRMSLPGKFMQLSDGFVHYEVDGHDTGDIVVLVHGFSSPLIIWDNTFDVLIKNGFRVLRYDLYGRGFSDRPNVKYNIELFYRQLHEIVKELDLTQKAVNLVGLSMGGIICIVFADRHPDLVKKISLIDPAGFPTGKRLFPIILKVPGLNYLILKFIGHERLIKGQMKDFYNYDQIDDYLKKYKEQTYYKGFLRAISSTILNFPFGGFTDIYKRVGARNFPMQLFWGEKDRVIPFTVSKKVQDTIPHIEFHTIKESGHIPHYTHSNEVNPLLIEFLKD
jgi:pimeloyl-ACP methyl ester carboxylesterase